MTVQDYMTTFLSEHDHPYSNAVVLKWINILEGNLDNVKTYLAQYYAQTVNTFQYTLPDDVSIMDVKSVYVNGKKYKKKDLREYHCDRSYWYENGKLCIFPACHETDASYVSDAGDITFAADSITTTGDDFAFSTGDTIMVSGAAEDDNNTYAVITSTDDGVLYFTDDTFTAGADAAVVTISRPKIKVVYEYKPTTKLIADVATDTLNLADRWVEIYDYFIMQKIAYLKKNYEEQQNHAAMFDLKVKEYENWWEAHRPMSPDSDLESNPEGWGSRRSVNFDTEA